MGPMSAAMAVVGAAALGLFAWAAVWPAPAPRAWLARSILLVLALSFVVLSGALTPWPGQVLTSGSGVLVRLLAGLMLCLAAIAVLLRADEPYPPDVDPRVHEGLWLLSLCGALLAVSGSSLSTLSVGLSLATVSALYAARHDGDGPLSVACVLGLCAHLFGLALIYASVGTADLDTLTRHFWTRAAPPDALAGTGAALYLAGIALATGGFPPSGHVAPATRPLSIALGVALILRLYVGPFAAWSGAWAPTFHLLGTATMLFGISSGAALATVVGVLIEVPVMLMLVRICLRTRHRFPRTVHCQPVPDG